MAAREDESQTIVGNRAHWLRLLVSAARLALGIEQAVQERLFVCSARFASHAIDGAAAGGGGEPGTRIGRDTAAGPGFERRGQGVLHDIFGEVEVADLAD